ncbi:MAG TPA: antibiotic biosynthesis monooxygenase [Candidatus Limnocylindrales bacterium]|jgi:heme-degrading monooxygenase HmoA
MALLLLNRQGAWTIGSGSDAHLGCDLIVRVLRGRVPSDQVPLFRERAQQALAGAHGRDGLVYAQTGRQVRADGSEEIIFVSVWRDLEALYRWLGDTDLLDTPMVRLASPDVFAHFDVQHYEVLEPASRAPEEASLSLPSEAAPEGRG